MNSEHIAALSASDLTLLTEVLPEPPVLTDSVLCVGTKEVQVRDGVARFRDDSGYNRSFAMQWGHFRTNQLDEVNGTSLSERRFSETRWEAAELNIRSVL